MLDGSAETVQQIRSILDGLVEERRRLRAAGDEPALEANRRALIYWQQALSQVEGGGRRR